MINQMVQEFFPTATTVIPAIDPVTVVADGAARLAGILSNEHVEESDSDEDEDESVLIVDVTPLSLGIVQSQEVEQNIIKKMIFGTKYKEVMDVIIKKNSTIPFEKEKSY